MDLDKLFEITKLPKSTEQKLYIPKTAFYEHIKKYQEKMLLQDYVQSIYLLAVINSENTNLHIYENAKVYFNEILFIHIEMKTANNEDRIFKIISKTIPYPLVVIMSYDKYSYIYTGKYEKRKTNNISSAKIVNSYKSKRYSEDGLERLFGKINLGEFKKVYVKDVYEFIQGVILSETINNKNTKPSNETQIITAETKDKIDLLNKEINKYTRAVKNEDQINKRIPLQMHLYKLKEELDKIIS